MKKIDITNLETNKQINRAISDMYNISFIDFCLKYKYGKTKDVFKAVKYLKRLERRLNIND